MDVAIERELSFVLESCNGRGIPETSQFRTAVCRNWKRRPGNRERPNR